MSSGSEAILPVGSAGSLAPERQRGQRIVYSAAAAAGAQVVVVGSSLALVPLLMAHLGVAGYGAYATLMVIPSLLQSSDLGLGNTLIGDVARARSADSSDLARIITNATTALMLVGITALPLMVLLVPLLVGWIQDDQASAMLAELRSAATWLAVMLALGIPASVGSRIASGFERTWMVSVAAALSSLLGLVGAWLAVAVRPSIVTAVLCVGGSVLVVNCGLTGFVLIGQARSMVRLTAVQKSAVKSALRSGGLFLVLGVASALCTQLDMVIVASILGPEDAAVYSLCAKLFLLGPLAASFGLTPLWPAMANAIGARDAVWVRHAFWRAIRISSIVNTLWVAACLLGASVVVEIWTGGRVSHLPWLLLSASALWTLMNSLVGPLAVLLNAAHVVLPQVLGAVAMTLLNIVTSIFLTRSMGVSGPIWGSILGQLVAMLPFSALAARRLLRRIDQGI